MSAKVENIEWEIKDSNETDGKIIIHPVTDADVVNFSANGFTATNTQDAIIEVKGLIPDTVTANPTLAGGEAILEGLQIGNTKYDVFSPMSQADFDEATGGTSPTVTVNPIVDLVFPIGYHFITSNGSFNPNTAYPGTTWVQIKDKFILAAGDTYSNGATGGEATHQLTINEMPSHDHDFYAQRSGGFSGYGVLVNTSWSGGSDKITNQKGTGGAYSQGILKTGGDQAHNNMPPYIVRYVWERTA